MKKIMVLFAVMAMTTTVFAAQSVNINVNGNEIEAKGVIVEGRTLVPVRGIFEEAGYDVKWDAESKTATITNGKNTVEMTAGNTYFTYNGTEITPDVPQQIIEGSFMLPLRAVGDCINADVKWDAESKTASISLKTGLKVGTVLNLDKL